MLATNNTSDDDADLRELAARYCGALLAVSSPRTSRPRFMHALKLALVEFSREAIADGMTTQEEEAVFYESVATRIRLIR